MKPTCAAPLRQSVTSAAAICGEAPGFSHCVGVWQPARANSRAMATRPRIVAILLLRPGDRHQFVALAAHAEGDQAVLGIEALRLVVLPVEPAIRPWHRRRGDIEERLLAGRPPTFPGVGRRQ